MNGQLVVFLTLVGALALFIWGRWRYDIVALLALLAVTITGTIKPEDAFVGFGHPAVVTVACVLVVSRGLFNSGLVDVIANWMARLGKEPSTHVGAMTGLVTLFSGFMNNVGALALLMPVAIRLARRNKRAPSYLLMPLAFGSLLGGLITLIGTPPNIIIATFRVQTGQPAFRMFDFAPVGVAVALAGLAFIALIGWRLVPQREGEGADGELFHIEDYTTELRLGPGARLIGKQLRGLRDLTDADVVVVGLLRGEERHMAPSSYEVLQEGDILIVEATHEALTTLAEDLRLELVPVHEVGETDLASGDIAVMEAVVRLDSMLVGRTVRDLDLRWRHGLNLVAIARQGSQIERRLGNVEFRPGDVLLLQGHSGAMRPALATLGCLPLAQRPVRIGQAQRIFLASAIFLGALIAAAGGLVPVQIGFAAAAVAMVLTGCVSLRGAYESIEWPIIILLGGMIPVGMALESTGGAALIADWLLNIGGQLPPGVTLAVILIGTMFLSDLVNNAAAAVLMAPIAIGVSQGLGVSADPFLMAVSIGASCAFLTPIGHQSNTLVFGPGGYKFGDYWRMGLPLEVVIAVVSLPMIMWIWPFSR